MKRPKNDKIKRKIKSYQKEEVTQHKVADIDQESYDEEAEEMGERKSILKKGGQKEQKKGRGKKFKEDEEVGINLEELSEDASDGGQVMNFLDDDSSMDLNDEISELEDGPKPVVKSESALPVKKKEGSMYTSMAGAFESIMKKEV